MKKPFIQTMFVQGRIDNTTPDELDALKRCYQKLNPQEIYLITLNKEPADARLMSVSQQKIKQIRKLLSSKDLVLSLHILNRSNSFQTDIRPHGKHLPISIVLKN